MFLFKNQELKISKTQKNFAEEIGITQTYLSKIINRKKKCGKLTAYAMTKAIDSNKEILDFFERVD